MIAGHRNFIEDLWKHTRLRDFGNVTKFLIVLFIKSPRSYINLHYFSTVVKGNSSELINAYNWCVEGLLRLRTSHFNMFEKFVQSITVTNNTSIGL